MIYEFEVWNHGEEPPHPVHVIEADTSDEAWGKFNIIHSGRWDCCSMVDRFKKGKMLSKTDRDRKSPGLPKGE